MRVLLGVPACAAVVFTSAAWAIYGQPVQITGEGADEIPAQSISFITSTGTEIPVEEDDDDGFLIVFPGDGGTSGRLRIETDDGPVYIDMPVAGPGETIHVDLDTVTAVARPDGGWFPSGDGPDLTPFGVTYDFFTLDLPSVGFGTELDEFSSEESPVAALDGGIDLDGGSIDFALPTPGLGFADFAFFEATLATGSDEAQGSVAPGTNNVAITYQDFAPNDSTGLFLGTLGLDAWVQREVDVTNYKFGFGWAPMPLGNDGRSFFVPATFLDYGMIDTRITSRVTTPAYGDISQDTELTIEQNFLALAFGGFFVHQFNDRFSGSVGAFGLALRQDTNLEAMQYNMCGVCSDASFESSVYQSHDSTSLGFKGAISFDVNLTDNLALSFGAHSTYIDSIGGAFVPTSGDDLFVDNRPVELVEDSDWVTGGRIGLRLRY